MAARNAVLLELHRTTWRLALMRGRAIDMTPPAELDWQNGAEGAAKIRSQLDEWKIRKRSIVVGLSSAWCASTLLKLTSSRQAKQRQTMTYMLEPYLPWPAEEIIADFECTKGEAFAVAVPQDPLVDFVRHVEDAGIRIESIAPLSRLALQGISKQVAKRNRRSLLLLANELSIDCWLTDRGRPVMWRSFLSDAATLLQELKQIALIESNPLQIVICSLPDDLRDMITQLPFVQIDQNGSAPISVREAALHACSEIQSGAASAAIELRRDTLTHRDQHRSTGMSLQAFQISVLSLLIAVGFLLYNLGNEFDRLRQLAGDKQRDVYRRLFPEGAIPVGVRSRLEGEYSKLRGMRGDSVEVPKNVSAVVLVDRLLRSLPTEMRYRVLEVRIEQGRIYIVGQVREHADADRIAEELRKSNLIVENPSTHRLPQKGIEFRITAHLPPPPKEIAEAKS